MKEALLTRNEEFGSSVFLGDDPKILDLTPRQRVKLSAKRHACPRPVTTIKYYGKEWLYEWKQLNPNKRLPSKTEIEKQGIARTRRRYDECDFVTGLIWEKAKKTNKRLYNQLIRSEKRHKSEKMGVHEKGAVPKSHKTHISPLSSQVGYALPREVIEVFGWDGRKRTWESYETGLKIIDKCVKKSKTKEELLARVGNAVYKAGGRPEKILDHMFSGGILEEENNFNERRDIERALKKHSPSLWKIHTQG